MRPSELELLSAGEDQQLEMARLVRTWDAIRNTATVEISDERLEHFRGNLMLLVKIQARLRGHKQRAHERALAK